LAGSVPIEIFNRVARRNAGFDEVALNGDYVRGRAFTETARCILRNELMSGCTRGRRATKPT